MRVLAFDTATAATAVALTDVAGGGVAGLALEARDDPPAGARPGHAARLLVLIDELLRQGGGWEAVDRIAVGVGPGTFTGLRIGVATGIALARAREIPLVGVSTLASLALAARGDATTAPDQPLLAVIDARRGELFAAAWGPGTDPASAPAALDPCVLDPEGLATAVAGLGPGTLAVGDGAVKSRAMLERAGAVIPPDVSALHRVSGRGHCRLAAAESVAPGSPDAVRPVYLRLPDAEIARRERSGS
jgi:tRNA threonylcarbamoyl adenosine modification protein YeaZ